MFEPEAQIRFPALGFDAGAIVHALASLDPIRVATKRGLAFLKGLTVVDSDANLFRVAEVKPVTKLAPKSLALPGSAWVKRRVCA